MLLISNISISIVCRSIFTIMSASQRNQNSVSDPFADGKLLNSTILATLFR